MSDLADRVLDWVHDHVVSKVDPTTSAQTPDTPKYRTPPGSVNVGTGIAAAGAQTLAGRSKQLSDAMEANGA